MASTYPNAYDSDLEIPRINDDVSEIGGDTINSIRDAIFAIQKNIGLNSQGNKTTLADRINVSIDSNGYIKKSALEQVGLVTLPILDRHVGTNAGIKESKLDLDYSTSNLKTSVNSLSLDLSNVRSSSNSLNSSFNLHILGQANFHDGYQIKINSSGVQYGIAGLEATTIGDAINEISSILLSGNSEIVPQMEDLD